MLLDPSSNRVAQKRGQPQDAVDDENDSEHPSRESWRTHTAPVSPADVQNDPIELFVARSNRSRSAKSRKPLEIP